MQSKNSICSCGSGKKYKMCCGKGVSSNTGKGVDFTVGKSTNVNYARRFATKQDYLENIDVVLEVWETYKKMYAEEVQRRGGLFSVEMMNELVLKAKKQVGTTEKHEVAVEGLFDSYVAQMTTIKDSGLVHFNIDRQLFAISEEREMKELGLDVEIEFI